jgi:hypothetical protein
VCGASEPAAVQRGIYDAFELQPRYSRPREEIAINVAITRDTNDRPRDLEAERSASHDSRMEHRSPKRAHVLPTPDTKPACPEITARDLLPVVPLLMLDLDTTLVDRDAAFRVSARSSSGAR